MLLNGSGGGLLRTPEKKTHDQTWAISYADFLMVLLSFFIIFFSTKEESYLHVIAQDILKGYHGKVVGTGVESAMGTNLGTGMATGTAGLSDGKILTTLSEQLKNAKLDTNATPNKLIIELPNDVYLVGQYQAPQAELKKIADAIADHQKSLMLTVIGHSDQQKFPSDRKDYVNDNLTLASARATLASKFLRKEIPGITLRSMVDESNVRDTRSLTLMIEEK